jgi:glutathione S-transferase
LLTTTLQIGDKVLFESKAILEYFDEVLGNSTLPVDPLEKASLRAYLSLMDE